MDYKKLSSAELRKLADELEEKNNLPIKRGFLKEDFFILKKELIYNSFLCITQKEKLELIKEFEDNFIKIPKGTKLVCYKDSNGYKSWESWCDENEWFGNMDEKWAKKYLTDIQEIV